MFVVLYTLEYSKEELGIKFNNGHYIMFPYMETELQ